MHVTSKMQWLMMPLAKNKSSDIFLTSGRTTYTIQDESNSQYIHFRPQLLDAIHNEMTNIRDIETNDPTQQHNEKDTSKTTYLQQNLNSISMAKVWSQVQRCPA